MTQVLEYIMQHYTLFFGAIILILLAIVGYYADKTNFGQGKKSEQKKETNDNAANIENVGLSDVLNNENVNNIETEKDNILDDNQVGSQISENPIEEKVTALEKQTVDVTDKQLIDNSDNSISLKDNEIYESKGLEYDSGSILNANDDIILNTQNYVSGNKEEQDNDLAKNEEEFNKFSDEFNSILPRRELINMDLLSDIDDLELGKTQKIDLSSVPDLDDIELPKIKNLSTDEEDIWKF